MGTVKDVIEELKAIAGHESLDESITKKKSRKIGKYNPFKRYSPIGPGPNLEFGTRTVARQRDWKCKKTGPYGQMCVGISKSTKGRKKRIKIKPGYKKAYNRRYKEWSSKANSK